MNTKNLPHSPVLLSGPEAVVQLMLEQKRRDSAAGWNTAGFISGYRGSPLGTLDMSLWQAAEELKKNDIHFTPGVNEDLAATAVWGTQYVGKVQGAFAGARFDGVFGLWYGKGPGVDRSGDALKHGNLAGTSPLGGALVLAGDDHAAKSSTTAHQSEQALIAAGIPVLYPADVQDIVHLGLHGLAMSRSSGCWIGLKLVTDVVETTRSVDLSHAGPVSTPMCGEASRAIRVQDQPRAAEERLMREKLPVVNAYVLEKGLNPIVINPAAARRGLVASGKSYSDMREALALLGLNESACHALGLRVMKMDMVWPLVPSQMAAFAEGLSDILVIEEKRGLIEDQLKSILYDLPQGATRPQVLGKQVRTENQETLALPSWGEFDPLQIARVLARWLELDTSVLPCAWQASTPVPGRLPSFCSGCPHSTSTRVPQGSRALAGIGCHGMATIRQVGITTTMSQMGGEGAMWIGQAPFTDESHVFANIGDGTYFHSGFLAMRAAVAAKVNITYKLLVNGFVSMTGGQPIDGELSVPNMIQELLAEGVAGIVLVTDDVSKYAGVALPGQIPVRHRRELDVVQRELRERQGVTVLIYEQPCATERRRLRRRGQWPDPAVRTFIHPAVCEGCGDCGKASDCLSVEPLETPFGRKRRINQSSCNKDRTCVDGFCPSFITVHGGEFKGAAKPSRQDKTEAFDVSSLPEPVLTVPASSTSILFAGIGGTGVVTATAVLAKAAHLQGLAVSVLDVTGLSQKYGAVQSHLRLATAPGMLAASRIAPGQGDVLIGCDLLVAAEADALSRLRMGQARSVVNASISPSADFTRNPDWSVDREQVKARIDDVCAQTLVADATAIAERELGDAIGANLILLGMAWQRGYLPVNRQAIEAAISSQSGASFNRQAFELGRRAAHDEAWLRSFSEPVATPIQFLPRQTRTLSQWMDMHRQHLTAYQGASLVRIYEDRVNAIAYAEKAAGLGDRLSIAVAQGYFKLLAHKDEFEVARLLTDPAVLADIRGQFSGPVKLHFHLGGGPLAKNDPITGKPVKREMRGWIVPAMKTLAALRGVRDTWIDPWRHNAERRLANAWRKNYELDMALIERTLNGHCDTEMHQVLTQLAKLPDRLRGYGHVREEHSHQLAELRKTILNQIPT